MSIQVDDRDFAVTHIIEFVDGYALTATRIAYRSDLTLWHEHCRLQARGLFEVGRGDIEGYARRLEADGLAPATVNRRLATITGFYRWALDEGLVTGDPAGNVRRPRRPSESPRAGLSRTELKDWLDAAEAEGGHPYALACLLANNGLRVGEACGADVDDLAEDRWHHTLTMVGKGDRPAVIPLPPRTVAALEPILTERRSGPLLFTRAGSRMNRPAAARIVARLARRIGCGKHITPHSLRHSAITAALNAGVSLRDVQEFARHADPDRPDLQGLVGQIVADVPEPGMVRQPLHRRAQLLEDTTGRLGIVVGDPGVDVSQVGGCRPGDNERGHFSWPARSTTTGSRR